jgi:murein DD-endopeptidase MepM/ murein hydrolase activator NlpD
MAMGTIETNLWDAMLKNNIDPMMSIEISEIYAWSIDFFDLKKGDKFYVIYEDEVLDDTLSVGVKNIKAALFNHQNEEFYAIHFPQETPNDYYNEEGDNLRNQFLKTPLKYSRISSKYTKSRYHPVLKIYRPHSGIDYAAPVGTPVYSVGDGIVLKKGYHKKGAGNFIKIKHDKVYTTQYAHLQKFAIGLKNGDIVKQGQLIGYVGSTGYSTGPHLDFRFFENGQAIDPLAVHAQSGEPIQQINRIEFERLRDVYIYQLRGHKPQFLVAWKEYMADHEEV